MAGNTFSQLGERLSRMSSLTGRYRIGIPIRTEGLNELLSDLQRFIVVLKNRDVLVKSGAQAVQARVIQRAVRHEGSIGQMVAKTETGIWNQREQWQRWNEVIGVIANPVTVLKGSGKAGFASKSQLDNIRLIERLRAARSPHEIAAEFNPDEDPFDMAAEISRSGRRGARSASDEKGALGDKLLKRQSPPSEFNILWQIGEFGTGIYAEPDRRLDGVFKIPGGGGAWWISPFRGPTIYGQIGGHFLFPYRTNIEDGRQDLEAARRAIDDRIALLLEGRG